MRKNRICLNAVSQKIPDSLSEDRLMFSSAGAQPISLKSFRGLGHFPNKIARVYKHEHCLGGSVVTETVFAYPGLGSLLIESVNYRDYPAIQSLILIFSLQFIVINLIVDILYAVLNPEIKLQ